VQDFADLLSYLWPLAVPSGNYSSCLTTGTAGPPQQTKEQNIFVIENSRSGTVKTSPYWLQPCGWKLFVAILKSLEGHVLRTILKHVAAVFILNVRVSALVIKKEPFSVLFVTFNRKSEHKIYVSMDCRLKYLSMSDFFI
jgi:hypothetical protein